MKFMTGADRAVRASRAHRADRGAARRQRRAERKASRAARQAPGPVAGSLRGVRAAALWAIGIIVAAASLTAFTESYRALMLWALHHGLHGVWAAAFPAQVDTFVLVGELALFVALADGWAPGSRTAAWTVTLTGLAVSVAGNVGHVSGHLLSDRVTAAIPPLAAAAALAVGLGVLKRVVEAHHERTAEAHQPGNTALMLGTVPADVMAAAKTSYAATVAAGNPLSQNQLMARFGLTRAQAAKVRQDGTAQANGSGPVHDPDASPPDTVPAAS